MKRELLASFRLAREQRDKGNQQAALELLHDLTTKDPNSAAILAALGALCWDMQLWVDAVNAFREALRLSRNLKQHLLDFSIVCGNSVGARRQWRS